MNKEKQTRQDGNDGSLEDDDAMYMERIAKTALSVVKKPAGPKWLSMGICSVWCFVFCDNQRKLSAHVLLLRLLWTMECDGAFICPLPWVDFNILI